jgi:hypothetical protein
MLIKTTNKMKKIIIAALFCVGLFLQSNSQNVSLPKMDSTLKTLSVKVENYTYTDVYVTVSSISIGTGMYAPMLLQSESADSINVNAQAVVYASKTAMDNKAQSLTSIQVNFKISPIAILPDHWAIKKTIYSKLQ